MVAWIDRLLPRAHRTADPDEQRRARTLFVAFGVWVLSSVLLAPLIVQPEDALPSFLMRLALVPLVVCFWFLPLDRATTLFLAAFTVIVTGHNVATGQPSLYVLVMVPVAALLLSAPGGVLRWTVMALIALALVAGSEGLANLSVAEHLAPIAIVGCQCIALLAAETFMLAEREALADHRKRFQSIAEGPLHILEFKATRGDPLDAMTHSSPNVGELAGYAPEELAQRNWRAREFLHPDDLPSIGRLVRAAYEAEDSARTEFRIRHRNGHWVWVEANLFRAYESASGGFRRAVGLRDITREKNERNQLIDAQRLKSLGTLAGGMAHDFNNLLTVIGSYAEAPMNPRASAEIRRAVDSARDLTNRLLEFGQQQSRELTPVRLDVFLAERESMLAALGNRRLTITQPEDELGTIEVDISQLEQIVLNLVANARDATQSGGSIHLSCRNAPVDADRGASLGIPPGDYVCLEVADDGIGMDETTKARAFEPFFTTKRDRGGNGLGLASVYGIVEQSHGAVALRTAKGEGTVVEVYLPRQLDAATSVVRAVDTAVPRGSGETILLVEDDRTVRDLLVQRLADLGYKSLFEDAAEPALESFSDAPDAVDLLLTDVALPAMSGPQLASAVRDIRNDLPVLFVSGHDGEALWPTSIDRPDTGFLAKPFTASELAQRIRALLDGTAGSPAPDHDEKDASEKLNP